MKNPPMKILLVDDMDIIMDIIISHLETMGKDFIYLKAHNGREACKMALQAKPNLIIMDWEMPQMNGIDALQHLKKNNTTKDIPVIISSGFSDSINVQEALESGAIDYIRKPIDPIELIARVKSVLTLNSTFEALKQKQLELELEQQKVNRILDGILPSKIVDEIKQTGTSKPQLYKCASVMFADLVGFTVKSKKMSPKRLINELNDIFSSFDQISTKNKCTRIKTIGDAYLMVSGLPETDSDHAFNMIKSAFEFRDFIIARNEISPIKWELRIGISSGDVIGSLVGFENYLFDVFGETVNTASRIQHKCKPNTIAISEFTYLLTLTDFTVKHMGDVKLKGINDIEIFEVIDYYKEPMQDENLSKPKKNKKKVTIE